MLTKGFASVSRALRVIFVLFAALVMANCGGGGSSGPSNANPTGYYDTTGTATVGDGSGGTLNITDLQGLVNGNHFIALSLAQGLVYDGMISSVSLSDFNATVSVYKDGVLLSTAPMSGIITQGKSISGDLKGTGQGSGSFILNYALNNNQVASISRVQNNANEEWMALVGGSASTGIAMGFIVDTSGGVVNFQYPKDGAFNACVTSTGKFNAISGRNLFSVDVQLSNCANTNANGTYTGLAATVTNTTIDDTLVLIVSNANFSMNGAFVRAATL